uniref:Transmembrane protein n=1 Tax=Clastoptera arizonana TaxID=38151 RepID=A0A1B6DGQ9_9HEMI
MQRLKLFSVIIIFLSILISCLFKLSQNLNNLTYTEYCPFCCGTSLCEVINNGEIQFDDAYFFQNTINRLFSNKLTLFGVWGNKSVVIKTFKLPQQQVVTSNKRLKCKFDNIKSAIQNIKNILNERVLLKYYNFRKIWLCPNADNVDFLISVNSENNTVYSNDSEVLNDYIHFWTLLQFNAEPIIQKVCFLFKINSILFWSL